MKALKSLETAAKLALAFVASLLFWRPGRKAWARARLTAPRKVLLVRIDDRVGEALMTTPLIDALKRLPEPPRVELLVHRRAVRVLAGHPRADRVLGFERRFLALGALAPGLRALRREAYDVVINCASWAEASVTAALVSRMACPDGAVLGPRVWPSGWLCDVPVAPLPDTRSETRQRLHLGAPLAIPEDAWALSFRPVKRSPALEAFLGGLAGPWAVLYPGGRLEYRRVPPQGFAEPARQVLAKGLVPVVAWGPGEEPLARAVCAQVPGAVLAPPTDMDELAALLADAKVCVCNNTGPMHLSVAVGTPTVALFLHMEAARWGHPQAPHRVLDVTPLAGRWDEVSAQAGQATREVLERA